MQPNTRRTWPFVICVAVLLGYGLFSGGRETPPAPRQSPTKPAEQIAPSILVPPAPSAPAIDATRANSVPSAGSPAPAAQLDGAKPAGSTPRFGFVLPPTATLGDPLDLNIVIGSGQEIGRVVVEVKYDPAILRARSTEEIDYVNREPNERMLHLQQMNEGHVVAVLRVDPATAPLTSHSAGVVQFEAIGRGLARVEVSKISVSDRQNKPLPATSDGRVLQVAVQ